MRPGTVDLPGGGLVSAPPDIPPTGPQQPGELVKEVLHDDQLVQSTPGVVVQATLSEGDSTWRLRLHLAPGSPEGETYKFQIDVTYPSFLPILTRRIPLGFFRQGFQDNWNDQHYVSLNINANKVFVEIDQELASYYRLQDRVIELNLPYVTVNNVRTSAIRLDAGAEDNPFPWLSGHLPFFQLTVGFTNADPHFPITVDGPLFSSLTLHDLTFSFKFFLSAAHQLTYVAKFESPLLDQVPTSFTDPRSGWDINPRQIIEDSVERALDAYGYAVGAVLRTWFLGADFDLEDIRHDPATDEVVVDYVGLLSVQTEPVATVAPIGSGLAPITDPPLLEDLVYSPRGAGDSSWKPEHRTVRLPGDGLPHSLGPATTPGDLSKVDHIVVVMMENRSFDHMLGFLSRDNGRSDIEGLKAETGDNRTQFNFYNGRYYYPEKLTDTRILDSPHHHHEATKGQMADGMMHFVSNYAKLVGDDPAILRLVMGYYGGDQLTEYAKLAENYAVCDHWFASHVGPTIPNRFVLLTGDLNRDTWGEPEVDTPDYTTFTPSEADTLFDHLTARGVSWRYFQHRASMMRVFTKYTFDMVNVVEFDNVANGFLATVETGLPSVTFVDPAFGDLPAGGGQPPDNDDAPPADLLEGQKFIRNVVETLFDPAVNTHWMKTMLVIVYDEHGGFYDHVDPPSNFAPLLGQNSGKLGPRVPAFVVSPWTPQRTVLKDVFEHASIPATILRRFCSPHPPPMGPRVAAARDLRGALSLARARGDRIVVPPTPPGSVGVIGRTVSTARRFVAPRNPDDYGAFLGGALMTTGTAPRSATLT